MINGTKKTVTFRISLVIKEQILLLTNYIYYTNRQQKEQIVIISCSIIFNKKMGD